MPNLGSVLKSGKRDVIITHEYYKEFVAATKIDISYKDFRGIIIESNKFIAETIVEDTTGFKLPASLGYIVVKKYKTRKLIQDQAASKKLGKRVYHHNAHSFGNKFTIKWYKRGQTGALTTNVYIIQSERAFTRGLSKAIKAGKEYHEWSNSDFWSRKTVLRKLYNLKNARSYNQ